MKILFSFRLQALLVVITLLMLSGCATTNNSMYPTEAKVGFKTAVYKDLKSLPPPKEKVVAAVYNFRDQTGQYKTSDNGISYSTAVTQGATSMLIEALEESGWFIPIEREGLSNLLNERKIIRSSRENYTTQQGQQLAQLPPLLYAGIILEGGIISYETNIITGGSGAKYFGLGASGKYRQDRVTIYLRAISTQTGRVLKSVRTTKTILSKMIDVNLYRFVRFKRLLEVETGISYNEPPQMCVLEAIQKAVQSLIIEGVFDQLWALQQPQDIKSPMIRQYLAEKEDAQEIDETPYSLFMPKTIESIGLNYGGSTYSGDYAHPMLKPAGEFHIRGKINSFVYLQGSFGLNTVADKNFFNASINYFDVKALLNLLPNRQLSLFLQAGGSLFNLNTKNYDSSVRLKKYWLPAAVAGVAVELRLSRQLGINLTFDNHYAFSDKIDGLEYGKMNDQFWGGRLGFQYYLR